MDWTKFGTAFDAWRKEPTTITGLGIIASAGVAWLTGQLNESQALSAMTGGLFLIVMRQQLPPMTKMLAPIAIGVAALLLAACSTTSVTLGPQGSPAVQVPSVIAGLAKLSDADLKAAMADLSKTNGGQPPTAIPLVDDYACVAWLDASLPSFISQASGIIPSGSPAGPIDAFIQLKIATTNAQGVVSNATTQAPAAFAHYCGAAVQDDVSTATAILAKVGINVALPATGGLSGILGAL